SRGAVRARIRQRPLRAGLAQRLDVLRRFPSRRGLGRVRPRSGHRRDHRPAIQSHRDAGRVHHRHQPALARFQRAASSLLRADVEHAQLGPLQRALWTLEAGADRQDSAAGSALGGADARPRDRSAEKLKAQIMEDAQGARWIEEDHLFENYKQLQFFDTLALYFNRTHPSERDAQEFEHVPLNARQDVSVTIRPRAAGVYEVSPYPFAANAGEFAFAGRFIEPRQKGGGWPSVLRQSPTRWESFRLVAA